MCSYLFVLLIHRKSDAPVQLIHGRNIFMIALLCPLTLLCIGYIADNPTLWLNTYDLISKKIVSVANLVFSLFKLYILSAWYLRLIGNIADLVTCWLVASKVDFSFLITMHYRSDISFVDSFKFCECDKKFLLTDISHTAGVAMLHNCCFIFEPK